MRFASCVTNTTGAEKTYFSNDAIVIHTLCNAFVVLLDTVFSHDSKQRLRILDLQETSLHISRKKQVTNFSIVVGKVIFNKIVLIDTQFMVFGAANKTGNTSDYRLWPFGNSQVYAKAR